MKRLSVYVIILLSGYNPPVGRGQTAAARKSVTVALQGDSVLTGTTGSGTVQVTISTAQIPIGDITQPPPPIRGVNCTYSRNPCSQVTSLSISVSGKRLFIPRSVFADRTDVGTMTLTTANGLNVLALAGGEASEAYSLKIVFDGKRVRKRELYADEAKSLLETTVYSAPVVMN
jgi:hypothetical protein